jgi:hypothetical protein
MPAVLTDCARQMAMYALAHVRNYSVEEYIALMGYDYTWLSVEADEYVPLVLAWEL